MAPSKMRLMNEVWSRTVAMANPEWAREKAREKEIEEFEALLIQDLEEKNTARAAALATVPLKATPQQKPGGPAGAGRWKAKAEAEAADPDKIHSRHWKQRGGKMRDEPEIGEIAFKTGYKFSMDTKLDLEMKAEYEATRTTSLWETTLKKDKVRGKEERAGTKKPRPPPKRQRTKWPGSDIDSTRKAAKFAHDQWRAHVAKNPNAIGLHHISQVRHYIRETERLLAAHPKPGAIPEHSRFFALVLETRGRKQLRPNDGTIVPRVFPKVPWYTDVVNTPDLGTLPDQFRYLYETILEDLRLRGGDVWTDPLPDHRDLRPQSGFADDDLEEDWDDLVDQTE